MRKLALPILIAAAFAVPVTVFAQTAAPVAEKPAESGPITIGGFELTGYVDVGYTHLSGSGAFNTTPAGPGVTIGGPDRVFDYKRNAMNLHQAAFTFAMQPKEGFGGLLNVTLGRDADAIAAYSTNPSNGNGCNLATGQAATGSCKKDAWDITQAFVQYATGPITIIGGKFVTSAGAEVINSPTNSNYSRSILFGYAIPFTHTGIRASYAPTDTLAFTGGLNQGWDALKDTNTAKTAELGVTFTPNKEFSLAAMGHFGKERVGGLVSTGPEGSRNLIDLVATYNATDKLTLILNYDYATQDNTATAAANGASKSKWAGLAGYVNYQFTEQWRMSFRAEYFDDSDGYRTGVVQKWKEATLTLGYTPLKNLDLRAEVRADRSNVRAFVDANGTTASNNQNSFGVQAIFKF
jgi:predicted porin